MNTNRKVILSLLSVGMLMLAAHQPVQATVIRYEAINLTDIQPGEDRWQYRYMVSNFSFPADFGFDIFFDLAESYQFGDLEADPPEPNADWDVISLQPDPNLLADGVFDALALVDNASLADPFTITFIWRGSGTPGAQRFEVFDSGFNVIERGMTIAATTVPEPGPGLLVGAGLLSLGWRRIRRTTRLRFQINGPAFQG